MSKQVRELTRAEIDALYGGAARVRTAGGNLAPLVRDGMELQTRAQPIGKSAVDIENRTIDLAFSSEAEYERYFGIEILDHSKKSIRTDRLKNNVPVCLDHILERRVGALQKPQLGQDRMMRGVAKLSRVRPEAEYELQDAADGIPSQVSVGYFVHKMVLEEERDDGPSVYRVTDWEPFEVSFVSAAADQMVGVGRSQESNNQPGEDGGNESMPDEKKVEAPAAVEVPAVETKQEPTPEPEPVVVQSETRDSAEDAADRKRIRCIKEIADVAADRHPHAADLAMRYIANGGEPEAYQKELFKMAETKTPPTPEIGLTKREVQRFNIINALRALADPRDVKARDAAGFEFEVSDAAQKLYGRERGDLTIPEEVMHRDLTADVGNAGGYLVGVSDGGMSMVEMLRNKMITGQLGVTQIDGLVGDFAVPKQTGGATAYHVHDAAVTESQQVLGQINGVPHTIGALTDIKRSMLKQSSISAQMFVENDLTTVLAGGIDDKTFNGAGSAGEPLGLANVTGIGTEDYTANAPTLIQFGNMWEEVAGDNVKITKGGWAMTAALYAWGMTTVKDGTTGSAGMIIEDGKIFGYPVVFSEAIAAGYTYFGNWPDLVQLFWGGLDITVDPYTGSNAGTLRVVMLKDYDIIVRHAQSFCAGV